MVSTTFPILSSSSNYPSQPISHFTGSYENYPPATTTTKAPAPTSYGTSSPCVPITLLTYLTVTGNYPSYGTYKRNPKADAEAAPAAPAAKKRDDCEYPASAFTSLSNNNNHN